MRSSPERERRSEGKDTLRKKTFLKKRYSMKSNAPGSGRIAGAFFIAARPAERPDRPDLKE
jgi:hypothetical protein